MTHNDCNCTTLAEFLPFVALCILLCIAAIFVTFTILRNRLRRDLEEGRV